MLWSIFKFAESTLKLRTLAPTLKSVALCFLIIVWPNIAISAEHPFQPIKVVTSFSILQDIVIAVGGDLVDVQTLVDTDSDPHAFEPFPHHAALLAKADLVVMNGLNFEPWMEKLLKASDFQGKILTLAAQTSSQTTTHPNQPAPDPHVWHDISTVIAFTHNLGDLLGTLRPDAIEIIHRREQAYSQKLRQVDQAIAQIFNFTNAEQPFTVATTHAGFDAFSKRYGVRFISPLGYDTQSEASALELASIITMVREGCVEGLFVENITNPRLIQQIAEETNHAVDGMLYSDALSDASGPAPTYIALMLHNARILVEAHYRNRANTFCKSKNLFAPPSFMMHLEEAN